MPKMSEQAQKSKKTQAYQKSREKRVQEVATAQDVDTGAASHDISTESSSIGVVRRVGRPPSEKTSKMVIVMDPELRWKLKTYCTLYGTTAANVIDKLVREFLEDVDLPTQPT